MDRRLLLDEVSKEQFDKDLYSLLLEDLDTSYYNDAYWYKIISESSRCYHEGLARSRLIQRSIKQHLLFSMYKKLFFQFHIVKNDFYKIEQLDFCRDISCVSYDYFKMLYQLNQCTLRLYVDDSFMRFSEIRAWNHFVRGLQIVSDSCRDYFEQSLIICKDQNYEWISSYPYEENMELLIRCYRLIRHV